MPPYVQLLLTQCLTPWTPRSSRGVTARRGAVGCPMTPLPGPAAATILGAFPVRHLDDHAREVPEQWLKRGGVIMPMY